MTRLEDFYASFARIGWDNNEKKESTLSLKFTIWFSKPSKLYGSKKIAMRKSNGTPTCNDNVKRIQKIENRKHGMTRIELEYSVFF